jgi:hypothetical protein
MRGFKVITKTQAAETRQAMFKEWLDTNLPTLKDAFDQGEIEAILYQAWKAGFFSGRQECTADLADHMTRMVNAMKGSS